MGGKSDNAEVKVIKKNLITLEEGKPTPQERTTKAAAVEAKKAARKIASREAEKMVRMILKDKEDEKRDKVAMAGQPDGDDLALPEAARTQADVSLTSDHLKLPEKVDEGSPVSKENMKETISREEDEARVAAGLSLPKGDLASAAARASDASEKGEDKDGNLKLPKEGDR